MRLRSPAASATERRVLLAAASCAACQPSTSCALTGALDFLRHYPDAQDIWERAVRGPAAGPSAALILTVRHASPTEVARSFQAAAGRAAA